MIDFSAFLASVALVLGYWCLLSLGTALCWWGLLESLRWLDRRRGPHPLHHPVLTFRAPSPAEAWDALLADAAA